jgi:hypothetical protein
MPISAKEAGRRGGSANTEKQRAARSRNGRLYGFQSDDTLLTRAEAQNIVENLQAAGVPAKLDKLYEPVTAPKPQPRPVLIPVQK